MHRTAQGCITGSQDPRHGFQWRLVYAHDTRFQCLCVSCSVADAVQRRLSSHPSKHRWACEAQLAVRPNNTDTNDHNTKHKHQQHPSSNVARIRRRLTRIGSVSFVAVWTHPCCLHRSNFPCRHLTSQYAYHTSFTRACTRAPHPT